MASINRTFTLDQLNEWGLPDHKDVTVSIETEDVGRRWMDVCTVIFKAPDDGYHYALSFDVGKTEYQEQSWDYDFEDTVDLARVELRKVTVEQWLPVDAEDAA